VRDGDDFDLFYAGTARRVTSYLYTVTGSRAEAEDAAQETHARAWQRWDKISGYGDPEGWVRTVGYRIAVNTWGKAVTRAAAHRRHGVPDDQPGLSPDYLAIVAALAALGKRRLPVHGSVRHVRRFRRDHNGRRRHIDGPHPRRGRRRALRGHVGPGRGDGGGTVIPDRERPAAVACGHLEHR
jgi:hypothetical protein